MSVAVMKQSPSAVFNSNNKSSLSNQMTESWIVIDEQIESDYVLIDDHHHQQQQEEHEHEHYDLITQQESRTGEIVNQLQDKQIVENQQKTNNPTDVVIKEKRKISKAITQQNTTITTINGTDNYIVDSNQQLFDKRDLFKKLCGA
ncbi:unnamed protein product [Didymodactylos carnosus]|uniref:Uncharacterized protein n=1 Tax=Didymodactylos carnosus TaxID=1234261 RepID=A0A813SPV9_9BILA|nr:unnamed protein product [Didymodactylos carnosus]CAF3585429.1 unnamed protein product [Didymodactylos carnosus]